MLTQCSTDLSLIYAWEAQCKTKSRDYVNEKIPNIAAGIHSKSWCSQEHQSWFRFMLIRAVYRIHFLDLFNLLCFSNQLPKTLPGDWTHSYLRYHVQEETWQISPSQTTAHPWTARNIFARMCKEKFPIIPVPVRVEEGQIMVHLWQIPELIALP